MICRVWRGWTTPENAAAYQALLASEIMPSIHARGIPGLLGHEALRRDIISPDGAHEVEHMTLMWFRSLEDIEGFVGTPIDRANLPPKALEILKRWDERVSHFERFDQAQSSPSCGQS
ncbi:MAG: antibiotic biosynthesis monooxygenase [Pseudomonadota bacterium]